MRWRSMRLPRPSIIELSSSLHRLSRGVGVEGSSLALRRLRAAREKFSIHPSPWRAVRSVAEKQSGQHGQRGIVIRGEGCIVVEKMDEVLVISFSGQRHGTSKHLCVLGGYCAWLQTV